MGSERDGGNCKLSLNSHRHPWLPKLLFYELLALVFIDLQTFLEPENGPRITFLLLFNIESGLALEITGMTRLAGACPVD